MGYSLPSEPMRRGAGQTGTYLVMALNDYKSDARKHEMLTRNPFCKGALTTRKIRPDNHGTAHGIDAGLIEKMAYFNDLSEQLIIEWE